MSKPTRCLTCAECGSVLHDEFGGTFDGEEDNGGGMFEPEPGSNGECWLCGSAL